jgi:HAMP domain-containing protein
MGGKKVNAPDKLTVTCFSLGFASRGWQWRALIPLVHLGRAFDAGNIIAI